MSYKSNDLLVQPGDPLLANRENKFRRHVLTHLLDGEGNRDFAVDRLPGGITIRQRSGTLDLDVGSGEYVATNYGIYDIPPCSVVEIIGQDKGEHLETVLRVRLPSRSGMTASLGWVGTTGIAVAGRGTIHTRGEWIVSIGGYAWQYEGHSEIDTFAIWPKLATGWLCRTVANFGHLWMNGQENYSGRGAGAGFYSRNDPNGQFIWCDVPHRALGPFIVVAILDHRTDLQEFLQSSYEDDPPTFIPAATLCLVRFQETWL